jgi:hypothetical protein
LLTAISGIFNYSFSQNNNLKYEYHSPRFIFELGGEFNVPVGQARGNLADFFKFQNYGLVYGVGFHFNVKYAANKKANLYPYFTGGFVQLQNDEPDNSYIDSNVIANGYPLPGSLIYSSTPGTSILALRNIHAGLGLQYVFNSRRSLIPFAGVEVNYNYIWGFYQQIPRVVPGNEGIHKTIFDIKPASRVGIGIDIGLDYRISASYGFVFGAKYKIANLFGKTSERTQPASQNPGDKNAMNLLDKSAPDINSNLSQSRNISYLQFYIGFSVFAGKRN